jgi:hypothetical protein
MQLIRIGCFALLAAMLATWISAESLAKAKVRLYDAQRSLYDSRATLASNGEPVSPMRYYGGPKSLMWRRPAAN